MTDEMLALAQQNAAAAGVANVEFLKGQIEAIPLPADSVDVVISNCVINLAADKPAVFREISRVLKPGGRMGVTDIVAEDRLTPEERLERGSYTGCIAGALSFSEFRTGLRRSDLSDVTLTPTHDVADGMVSVIVQARKPADARPLIDLSLRSELPIATPAAAGATAAADRAETVDVSAAEEARGLASSTRVRAFSFVVLAAASWGIGTVLSKRAVAEIPPLTLLAAQLMVSVAMLSLALRWTHQSDPRDRSAAGPARRTEPGPRIRPQPDRPHHDQRLGLGPDLGGRADPDPPARRPRSRRAPRAGDHRSVLPGVRRPDRSGGRPGRRRGTGRRRPQPRRRALLRRLQRRRPAMDRGVPVDARRRDVAADCGGGRRGARAPGCRRCRWSISPTSVTIPALVSIVASGVLYYGAAYLLYLNALRVLPVSIAAISFYLVPVFGVAAATTAGETLSATQWVGAAMTIAAVLAVGVVDVRRSAGAQPIRTQR